MPNDKINDALAIVAKDSFSPWWNLAAFVFGDNDAKFAAAAENEYREILLELQRQVRAHEARLRAAEQRLDDIGSIGKTKVANELLRQLSLTLPGAKRRALVALAARQLTPELATGARQFWWNELVALSEAEVEAIERVGEGVLLFGRDLSAYPVLERRSQPHVLWLSMDEYHAMRNPSGHVSTDDATEHRVLLKREPLELTPDDVFALLEVANSLAKGGSRSSPLVEKHSPHKVRATRGQATYEARALTPRGLHLHRLTRPPPTDPPSV